MEDKDEEIWDALRQTATQDELDEAFKALIRKGRIIKTNQVRDGKPVYIASEFATEEELKAARKSMQ